MLSVILGYGIGHHIFHFFPILINHTRPPFPLFVLACHMNLIYSKNNHEVFMYSVTHGQRVAAPFTFHFPLLVLILYSCVLHSLHFA